MKNLMKFSVASLMMLVLTVSCKKDEPIQPNQPVEINEELSLINLRDSLIGGFSLIDQFTNTDSIVCNKIDTMGKTILNLGSNCLGVFEWESGIYCAGINSTKIEAAVFPPYSIVLTENGKQQSTGQRKDLFVCKNNQFSFNIAINTIIIKSIVYTGSSLKLTCNDTSVHGSIKPDYCVIINL